MKKALTILILTILLTSCAAEKDASNRDNLQGTSEQGVHETTTTLPQ